jgi:hypothetical protein
MDTLQTSIPLDTADRFASLVLANVVREYPHHLTHVMIEPGDVREPRGLHPIFYGCFDWHSCVHGYWLLARLARTVPGLAAVAEIDRQFNVAFTEENIAAEIAYFQRPGSRGFERPYGWAWLLMLCDELSRHEHAAGRRWHARLLPMAEMIAGRFLEYLPKADYPMRVGMHGNSAFAFTLAWEFANSHGNQLLKHMLRSKARQWFLADANCQVWEPGQADFLSPCLMESLCMLRVLEREEFVKWFGRFLPDLKNREPAVLFSPANVSDRTDGHIAHLDGLNLSRAWCFKAIAGALGAGNDLSGVLMSAAKDHLEASLPHVFGDYAGEHWLATFAVLALS